MDKDVIFFWIPPASNYEELAHHKGYVKYARSCNLFHFLESHEARSLLQVSQKFGGKNKFNFV